MTRPSPGRTAQTLLVLAVAWAAWASAQEVVRPSAMTHEREGMTECVMCHQPESARHEGLEQGVCLWCHAADSPMLTTDPSTIPHKLEGMESCLRCHAAGMMEPVPDVPEEGHEDMADEHCGMCHKKAPEG